MIRFEIRMQIAEVTFIYVNPRMNSIIIILYRNIFRLKPNTSFYKQIKIHIDLKLAALCTLYFILQNQIQKLKQQEYCK